SARHRVPRVAAASLIVPRAGPLTEFGAATRDSCVWTALALLSRQRALSAPSSNRERGLRRCQTASVERGRQLLIRHSCARGLTSVLRVRRRTRRMARIPVERTAPGHAADENRPSFPN